MATNHLTVPVDTPLWPWRQTLGTQVAPGRLGKVLHQQPSWSGHTVSKSPQLSSESSVISLNINNSSSKSRALSHYGATPLDKETVLEARSGFQLPIGLRWLKPCKLWITGFLDLSDFLASRTNRLYFKVQSTLLAELREVKVDYV